MYHDVVVVANPEAIKWDRKVAVFIHSFSVFLPAVSLPWSYMARGNDGLIQPATLCLC